ncbi:MAG: VTT domain-containing protein [Bdellovibrionota bacterium]
MKRAAGPFGPSVVAPSDSVFLEGRNTRGSYHADRVSVLVDADRFFRAAAEAIALAEQQVFILGWDTDSRTELPCPRGFESEADETARNRGAIRLIDLLEAVVRRKPGLRVYLLSWDYAFIYVFEREALPRLKFARNDEERLRFVLDHEHPTLASHHQKIVVVDDEVAFNGGLDLTQRRWDTPEHRGYDPRRVDPGGHAYGPFHDVQMLVEGDVARELGMIARERWEKATGETIDPPSKISGDRRRKAWPPSAPIEIENVPVAISRTLPMTEKRPVHEVERLFLDVIARAQAFVYIENQYFTSPKIARAIAKRLREPDGPEFVMILPRDQTGWIEESTMGLLRSNALRIVERSDLFGRWRCFYPVVPSLGEGYVKVHSKVMIADDLYLRVGSANLNSRSLGLDSECDLSIETSGRVDVRSAIAKLRRELIGEHLGVDPAEFEARFLLNGSLVDSIDSFRGGERTLVDMRPTVPPWVGRIAPPADWIDPSMPKGIRRWFARRLRRRRHLLASSLIVVVTCFLFLGDLAHARGWFVLPHVDVPDVPGYISAAWNWIRSLEPEKLTRVVQRLRAEPWIEVAVLGTFVVGSYAYLPMTLMSIGLVLVFPPLEALALSCFGFLAAAAANYASGRFWTYSSSSFLNRPRVRNLSEQLEEGGLWTVIAVRLVPFAPFTIIGLVSGGLRIRFLYYMIGSLVGFVPVLVAMFLVAWVRA